MGWPSELPFSSTSHWVSNIFSEPNKTAISLQQDSKSGKCLENARRKVGEVLGGSGKTWRLFPKMHTEQFCHQDWKLSAAVVLTTPPVTLHIFSEHSNHIHTNHKISSLLDQPQIRLMQTWRCYPDEIGSTQQPPLALCVCVGGVLSYFILLTRLTLQRSHFSRDHGVNGKPDGTICVSVTADNKMITQNQH